jgi:hypothetical protein
MAVVLATSAPAIAQHTHDPEPASPQHQHAPEPSDTLFPAREASGTSWLPDATPMYAVHRSWRGWDVMLHGNLFAQFLYEPGERHRTGGFSTRQFSSTNWGMVMARRRAGAGRVGLRAMVSSEPWTVPGCGYLNYLATGETCEGDGIHDRQHPHELMMELAADYDRPLRGSLRWQVYGGLSGEPALGPSGFPHRASAMPNPIAPISHHWIDATHVTFGLITTGLSDRRWKAEVSLFNAREPDENRADLDLAPLDSISGRVTFLPTDRLSLQISAGQLHDAEAEFASAPRTSIDRFTASAAYERAVGGEGMWSTTIAYGVNSAREIVVVDVLDAATQALMVESSLTMRDRHTWFGRAEIVEKPAHDLHAHEFETVVFTVGKLQAGYVRHFGSVKGLVPGIGLMGSLSLVPPKLESRYGGRVAPGFAVFFNIRPSRHSM